MHKHKWGGWILLCVFSFKLYAVEVEPSFWSRHAQAGTFTGKDTISIATVKLIHPQAKAVVVLSGGRTESYLKYQTFIEEIYQQGYSVYAMDHRGQGLSGRMLAEPLKGHVKQFNDYEEDFTTFVKSNVAPEAKGKKIVLVAHSMGGSIAILTMARLPNQFAAAVLGSPMLEADLGIPAGCAIAAMATWFCETCAVPRTEYTTDQAAFEANKLTQDFPRFLSARKVVSANPKIALAAPTFGWVNQACASRAAQQAAAGSINTPILLLQSGADKVVLNEAQTTFCAQPNARKLPVCEGGKPLVVEGAYHELWFEKDEYRNKAMKAMFDFWQRHL